LEFRSKRFPILDISPLDDICRRSSSFWMHKYRRGISPEITINGKSSIYSDWLVKSDIDPFWCQTPNRKHLCFVLKCNNLCFIFNENLQIKEPYAMLNWIWEYLVFPNIQYGAEDQFFLANYDQHTVNFVFKVLEYLATRIDFRGLEKLMNLKSYTNEKAVLKFHWLDFYCCTGNSTYYNSIFTRARFINNGVQLVLPNASQMKRRFHLICGKSHRNWTLDDPTSKVYSSKFREQARIMLLISSRNKMVLQRGIVLKIIQYMAFNDLKILEDAIYNPNYQIYSSSGNSRKFEEARYKVQLCPFVKHTHDNIIETIIAETERFTKCHSRQDFIKNICDRKAKGVTNKRVVEIWVDVFAYYEVNKSLAGCTPRNCREIIWEGCEQILNGLLDRYGIVPYNFVEIAKMAGPRHKKMEKAKKEKNKREREERIAQYNEREQKRLEENDISQKKFKPDTE
jgi:hypothetical protein